MIIEDKVVEDLDGGVHAERTDRNIVVDESLLRLKIASLDQHLLELLQVKMNIFVLLKELMLVMCRLQSGILGSDVPNCSFHFFLHILYTFGSFNKLIGCLLDLLELLRAFLVLDLLGKASLHVFLIFEKCAHMALKLITATESLIDVVSGHIVLQATKHGLFKGNVCSFDIGIGAVILKHRFDFVKPHRHKLSVLIT